MATRKKSRGPSIAETESIIRELAFEYPEVHEDFPWGERALKVKGKAFVFMRVEPERLSATFKLPQSRDMAVDLPFAEPCGYGMGKYGWVTTRFNAGDEIPIDLLKAWVDESFRAVAPKRIVKTLGG